MVICYTVSVCVLTTTTNLFVTTGITLIGVPLYIGRIVLGDWLTADNPALLDRYITKDSRTGYSDCSGGWGMATMNRRARGGV